LKKHLLFLLLSFGLLFFVSCTKENEEDDGWSNCQSCTIESWKGEFSGKAEHFDAQTDITTNNLNLTIEFEETATDYLTAYILIQNYYSATLSGDLATTYSVSFAGSNSSISATLYTKDNQLRLSGNSKKFHYKVDNLVIEEVINFELYKDIE